MTLRVWAANTAYKQGDCVVISDGAGGYMGDTGGGKTWLLCCVGSGSAVDSTPNGVSGSTKTQNEWATLFEGTGSDGVVTEATVMPATLTAGAGPDGNIRWAMGVAFFMDTSAATNGNGAYATPYNAASSVTAGQITTQDGTNSTRHLYIKRGTTIVLPSTGSNWVGRGSSRRHYATLSDYGTGYLPRIDASATTGTTAGVLLSKAGANPSRYALLENFEVFGAAAEGVNVYLGTTESSLSMNNITLQGIVAHDNGAAGIQAICGGDVDRSASSTSLIIQNCKAYNNNLYGIAAREWWDGVQILNCETYENGQIAPNGSYGISTIGNYQAYTGLTTWVNTAGTTWRRTFTRTNNIITGRWRDASGNERILTLDAGLTADYTITNTAGQIDVRLGVGDDPNIAGTVVYVCYNRIKNIDVIGNKSYNNRDLRTASGRFDGEGIGIDQFSQAVRVARNTISGNDGGGIIFNQPYQIYVSGNSIVNNGYYKSQASQTVANILVNHPESLAWVTNNTLAKGFGDGLRVYSPNGVSVVARNNLIYNNGGSGLYGTLSVGGITNTYNSVFGNTTSVTNVSLDATDSSANWSTYLEENGALKFVTYSYASPNPAANFGTYVPGVSCLNGRAKPGWTPVGAYMGVVPRATATTRTTATTRATATSRATRNGLN